MTVLSGCYHEELTVWDRKMWPLAVLPGGYISEVYVGPCMAFFLGQTKVAVLTSWPLLTK